MVFDAEEERVKSCTPQLNLTPLNSLQVIVRRYSIETSGYQKKMHVCMHACIVVGRKGGGVVWFSES